MPSSFSRTLNKYNCYQFNGLFFVSGKFILSIVENKDNKVYFLVILFFCYLSQFSNVTNLYSLMTTGQHKDFHVRVLYCLHQNITT
jgi:hypothetical protein